MGGNVLKYALNTLDTDSSFHGLVLMILDSRIMKSPRSPPGVGIQITWAEIRKMPCPGIHRGKMTILYIVISILWHTSEIVNNILKYLIHDI